MKTSLLLFVIFALFVPGLAYAQSPQDPASELLAWGGDYFTYPQWSLNLTVDSTTMAAIWRTTAEFTAIVDHRIEFLSQQHDGSAISQFINTDWLQGIFNEWDDWHETTRCFDDTYLLVELNTLSDGEKFRTRYWAWSEGTTFKFTIATFEASNKDMLDDFGGHFFPALPDCIKYM